MPIYSSRVTSNTVRVVNSYGFHALAFALLTLSSGLPMRLTAQTPGFIDDGRGAISAGGELDNYLRYLQSMGEVPLTAWSLRPFAPAESDTLVRSLRTHPWEHAGPFKRDPTVGRFSVLPLIVISRYNSAYPYGSNDGAVWAGRGTTFSVQGGFSSHFGPLTIVLDPILFRAANSHFALQTNTSDIPRLRFADGDFPTNVDRPQRFGDKTYSAFDPGESTMRIDTHGVSVGVTSANQWWGPATTLPIIVGNNAAGIPRVFVGTEKPTSIGIGKAQIRVEYGIERQSSFSPVTGSKTFVSASESGTLRFMSGLVATFSPRMIPGLELGAARFFHQAWFGHVGKSELASPFEGLLKSSIGKGVDLPGIDDRDALKNQLASVFMRWVLPSSGFEVYAGYGHEDHNQDIRDLELEPDHSRIAMGGLRKTFKQSATKFYALRGEFLDGYSPTLERNRGQGLIYVHNPLRQGHTEDGQLIGADVGVGSIGGQIIAWDMYSPSGRSTFFVDRKSEDNYAAYYATGIKLPGASDMMATGGFERLAFTDWGSISGVISASYRGGFQRTMAARGFNLNLQLGATLTSLTF